MERIPPPPQYLISLEEFSTLNIELRRSSFIAVGVYSTNNALFDVGEVLVFGIAGAVLIALDFSVAPILLGYVLGPMVEENFRRALMLSRGNMAVFVERPISAVFVGICASLVLLQLAFWPRRIMKANPVLPTQEGALPACLNKDA